jgi:RHS repeat-associated protein
MMFAEVAGTQTAVPVYRLLDHEGSLAMTTDGSGNVTGTNLMTPYGETLSSNTSDSFQFAGLYQDPEYGGDHAMFRNYSTEQTRWLRPDPYNGSYDLANPQSFNRYMYVNGNPLAFTDPSGQGIWSVCTADTCSFGPWFPGVLNTVGSVVDIGLFAADFLNDVFGLWGQPPTFNGNVQASQSGKNVPQNPNANCGPMHPCTTVQVNGTNPPPPGTTPSSLPNTLPLSALASWPLNGNFWPGFTKQDGLCTTGPFANSMNSNPAILSCCEAHDACYKQFQCNASSFVGGLPGPCDLICNANVEACIANALF